MGDKLKIKHTRMTFDEWNRAIVKKNVYLSEDEEKRYGLIHIEKVKEKQVWGFLDGRPVVADDGFQWLVIVPKYKNYVITMYMDQNRKTILWYIDMIDGQGTDEDGVCFYNDLFLDLIILDSGEIVEDDMADFILVGLKLKISQKTEEKKSSRENTGGKRKTPSQSFHSKKKMLSDIYEAYAEGKIDKDTFLRKKENIREMFETEDVEAETKTAVVRTDLENLLEEVQSTADDSWLTREVLKVFVKEIWIFPESEMKIIWKPEWALEGAGKDSIGKKEK